MSAATSLGRGLHADGRVQLRVLTNSELREARACMRRHKLKYILKRRPRRVSDPLRFGTLWHVGQEAWWKCTGEAVEKLDAALEAMRAAVAKAASDSDPISEYVLVTVEELMLGYTARWADAEYRAVAVEQSFEVPLVNPATNAASRTFCLGGKVDAIVVDAQGKLHVLEHKSTASDLELGSLYWEKVRALDTQVSLYISGARAVGFDVEDCIYDVVRKPGIRPLKATPEESRKYKKDGTLYANQREHDETPEEFRARLRADISERTERYFARGTVVRLDADARDHAFDVWQSAKMLHEAERSGFAPKNPDACGAFGGCEYLAVCSGMASIDDDRLFRTANAAHEELQELQTEV